MTLSVSIRQPLSSFTLGAEFVAPPGITVLFGPSGAGKTTILNCISGLQSPDTGRISIDDTVLFDHTARVALPPYRRRTGTIFQDARLFPHLSVRSNLTYGRFFSPDKASPTEVNQIVEMLGIGGLLKRRPASLSGGERQRVAIGRALIAKPRLLLADEPLAALDQPRKEEILPYIETLRDNAKIPILYVTHSPSEVARLADLVVVLENGRVTRSGSPNEALSDPSIQPLGVRAVGAVLSAVVKEHHDDGLTEVDALGTLLLLPKTPHPIGRQIRVRIAAQDVILSREEPKSLSALNVVAGSVSAIRTGDGPGVLVSVKSEAGILLARVTRRSAHRLQIETGTKVWAIIKSVSVGREDIGG